MKIDISQKIMNKIRDDEIAIRPRWQFVTLKALSILGLSVLSIYLILVASGLTYIAKNQAFFDYLAFGSRGMISYIISLPWLAILMFAGIVALIVMMIKNFEFIYKYRYAPAALILLFLVFGGIAFGMAGGSSNDSMPAKIADAIRFNKSSPLQLDGKMISITGGQIVIIDEKANKNIIETNSSTYFKNGKPEVGDKILVLAEANTDKIVASMIKITKKADKKLDEKGEVKSEQTSNQKPAEKPKTETSNAPVSQPKTTQSSNSNPTPTPAPTPPPVGKTITITSVSGPMTMTSKYRINWIANFTSDYGFKLVWDKEPATPVYPTTSNKYYYFPGPASSGYGYVQNTLGPGTYNVKVCEYLGGSCGIYSSQVQVIFP